MAFWSVEIDDGLSKLWPSVMIYGYTIGVASWQSAAISQIRNPYLRDESKRFMDSRQPASL